MNPSYWALGISLTLMIAIITSAYRFGVWRGKVDNDRTSFKEFMSEVRADIKLILTRLPPTPTTSASPIRLTDLGEHISNSIDAKNWAIKTAQELVGETNDMDAFEIQDFSFKHAKVFDPDEALLGKMRETAFESGIDLSGVRNVLGVVLRDELLQMNNLQHSSLDK